MRVTAMMMPSASSARAKGSTGTARCRPLRRPAGANREWQPYAGGGLGAANLDVGDVPSSLGGDFDSDYNFAYQLIGGVAYNVNPSWRINGEVRFFGINDQDSRTTVLSFKTPYHTFDFADRRDLLVLIAAMGARRAPAEGCALAGPPVLLASAKTLLRGAPDLAMRRQTGERRGRLR